MDFMLPHQTAGRRRGSAKGERTIEEEGPALRTGGFIPPVLGLAHQKARSMGIRRAEAGGLFHAIGRGLENGARSKGAPQGPDRRLAPDQVGQQPLPALG